MRYLDLFAARPVIWTMVLAYLVVIAALAVLGRRRAKADANGHAVGKVGWTIGGMTMAASHASIATFVINPGFVYVHGVSALLHLGVAAGLGMALGQAVVCGRFRNAANGAVTLPQWIGQRYGSHGLRVLFAAINLLSLCFVVLIVGGLSIVVQSTLGLSNLEALIAVTVFVFGCIFVGGAYGNAYASIVQASIMAIVALMIFGSGLGSLGGAGDALRAADPNLVAPVNHASPLFGSFFSVYVSGFIIGFALMCQPHIMATALYIKNPRHVRRALTLAIILGVVFSSVLVAGIYARVAGIEGVGQDRVMSAYLAQTFGPYALALVTVALLAAGMSTMSAILVALSSIAGNDLIPSRSPAHARRNARVILVGLGVIVFAIALHPPHLLGIFGQLGVYGVVSAAAVPVVLGVLAPSFGKAGAAAAALTGPTVHFTLYFAGVMANPAESATVGILVSTAVAALSLVAARVTAGAGLAPIVRDV